MKSCLPLSAPVLHAASLAGALALAGVLGGCASDNRHAMTGAASSHAISKLNNSQDQYVAAWNAHSPDAVIAAMAPAGTYTSPGAGKNLSLPEFKGYMLALFSAVPDFKVQALRSGQIDANTHADEWVATGTWTRPFPAGPLKGVQPTGKSFNLPGTGIHQIQGDKIVSTRHYYDQMDFLRQIGVLPAQ